MLLDMKKDLDSVFRRIRYDLLVLTYRYSFRKLLKITVVTVINSNTITVITVINSNTICNIMASSL